VSSIQFYADPANGGIFIPEPKTYKAQQNVGRESPRLIGNKKFSRKKGNIGNAEGFFIEVVVEAHDPAQTKKSRAEYRAVPNLVQAPQFAMLF
jgi:hypothetical protein